MQPRSLVEPFVARIERLGIPYMVTGSTAGILYGEPRMTHDVDIVVALTSRDVQAFVDAFPLDEFYCPPAEVVAVEIKRGHRGHCNLIHHATGFKADIYIAFDELHQWALEHRHVLDLDGQQVQIAPIEYVILRKLEYFREGGSEKHLRDIRSMLEVSGDALDRAFLDRQIDARNLAGAWAAVGTAR